MNTIQPTKKMRTFHSIEEFNDAVNYEANQLQLKDEVKNKDIDKMWDEMYIAIYASIHQLIINMGWGEYFVQRPIDQTMEKFNNTKNERLIHVTLHAKHDFQYKYARDICMKVRRLFKKSVSIMIVFLDEDGNVTRKTFSMGI